MRKRKRFWAGPFGVVLLILWKLPGWIDDGTTWKRWLGMSDRLGDFFLFSGGTLLFIFAVERTKEWLVRRFDFKAIIRSDFQAWVTVYKDQPTRSYVAGLGFDDFQAWVTVYKDQPTRSYVAGLAMIMVTTILAGILGVYFSVLATEWVVSLANWVLKD